MKVGTGSADLPAAVSVVVLVESDERFLMIEEERGGESGPVWYFPSGALELGESLADAARREVREETGYLVEPIEVVAINHGAFTDTPGLHWWRFVIAARLMPDVPKEVEEPEILSVEWCSSDDISGLRLRSADASDLCDLAHSGPGLSLSACRWAREGVLEGFFA